MKKHKIAALLAILVILTSNTRTSLQLNKSAVASPLIQLEWKIMFTTGRRLWAGTDSDIFVELIGDKDKTGVIYLSPTKEQLEAKSTDVFSLGDLHGLDIGRLLSIIVVKQYTVGFFSDWELTQAVVTDPAGKSYVFNCNCWLTNSRNKRTLKVTATEDGSLGGEVNSFTFSRTARVFPITIILLSLFLILILFSYFGNVLCKKWRQNIQFLNGEATFIDISKKSYL